MEGMMPYEIRFLTVNEWDEAMGLAWKTFLEFEGDVYSPEGIRNFEDFITDSALKRMFIMGAYQMMGAFQNGKMIGMISLRNKTHISLLFVDKHYHRKGIGRKLIDALARYVIWEEGQEKLTVNASPYGVGFYHRLGFVDLSPEVSQNGITFTPMILSFTDRSK